MKTKTHAAASNGRRVHNAILLQGAVAIEVADQALGRGGGATKIVCHGVDGFDEKLTMLMGCDVPRSCKKPQERLAGVDEV